MSVKVLLVANVFPPVGGGAPVVYENLCRYLGEEMAVLTAKRSHITREELEGWREADLRHPCPVRRIEYLLPPEQPPPRNTLASAWRYLSQDLAFRRKVAREVVDFASEVRPTVICLGQVCHFSWLCLRLRSRLEIPVLYYVHGDDISSWTGSRILAWETSRALPVADGIVAVSSFARELLVRRGAHRDRIHVITNGVDAERFQPGEKDERLLSRYDARGKRILLTVTRLEERKGVDTVIRALPRILDAAPDALYLVVGDGSQRQHLETLATQTGVAGRVVFCGALPHESPELVRYYQTCDLFIMPNRKLPSGESEGFGLVFLEAGACGKPVIGGREGGVVDAVGDGETGVLVDGSSPEEVAAAAIRILRDRELAARMGSAGRARAARSTWRDKAEEFRQVCVAVARARR